LTDTLLRWQTLRERDTVTIRDGRATVRIVRLPGDSIWVQGECGDTVIRYVRQMVTKTVQQEKNKRPWYLYFVYAFYFIAFTVLIRLLYLDILRRRKEKSFPL
jgi:hypothetical protein